MKISKLFHWLYALVMLLPIFAIGVTCGYAMFNKNAYQSYYGNTINQEQYNYYNFSELELNETYFLQTGVFTTLNTTSEDGTISISNFKYNGTLYENANRMRFYYTTSYATVFIQENNDTIPGLNFDLRYNTYLFEFQYENNLTGNNTFNYFGNNFYQIQYIYNSFIDNVFYYAVDKVTESPLFSWAYNSFLAVPFTYITNLFGIPSTSVIIELLSYWLAISIIWLVFDLIMYVPLLVHRWIDKGVLE